MGSEREHSGSGKTWCLIARVALLLSLCGALSWGYHQRELIAQLEAQNSLLRQLGRTQRQYVQTTQTANYTCLQALQLVRQGLGLDDRRTDLEAGETTEIWDAGITSLGTGGASWAAK